MYILIFSPVAGFLPDSVTYGVHPDLWVLTAVEELVSGSRLDKIGEAVAMLEYLHSHYPDLGEEREYVNLIVDMKTKVGNIHTCMLSDTLHPLWNMYLHVRPIISGRGEVESV